MAKKDHTFREWIDENKFEKRDKKRYDKKRQSLRRARKNKLRAKESYFDS